MFSNRAPALHIVIVKRIHVGKAQFYTNSVIEYSNCIDLNIYIFLRKLGRVQCIRNMLHTLLYGGRRLGTRDIHSHHVQIRTKYSAEKIQESSTCVVII